MGMRLSGMGMRLSGVGMRLGTRLSNVHHSLIWV